MTKATIAEERKEATMTSTSEAEFFRALSGWQRFGNCIEKTFNFDDFGAAARFVGRMADDGAVAVVRRPSTSAAIA
jgi:pterin-4a-carbinolamine dehydratase